MAFETCTPMFIHPDFKPDSPFQSILETSSSDQLVSYASISVSEDQTYVVQPINVAQSENTLQTTIYTLFYKPIVLEPVLQPAEKPVLDVSNMDISDSDEEDKHIIIIEPSLDTHSTSTNQPNKDQQSTSQPQTINVSPPPTFFLDFIILKEVCENIFEDLNRLVKARNDPVHTENYEDQWIALIEVVDRVFCDLQRLSIEAQNQSINKWFKEVIKSMEEVEIRRNKFYISDSPFLLDVSSIIC